MSSGRRASSTSTLSSVASCPSLRMVLLGEDGVGKTSLLRRLSKCGRPAVLEQDSNGGGKREGLHLDVSHVARLKLQCSQSGAEEPSSADLFVYDPLGHTLDPLIAYNYFADSCVGLAVYDVTNLNSYRQIVNWVSRLRRERSSDDLPLVLLVGNKADSSKRRRKVTLQDGEKLCNSINADWFGEISAKTSGKGEFEFIVKQVTKAIETGRIGNIPSSDSPGRTTPCRRLSISVLRRSSSLQFALPAAGGCTPGDALFQRRITDGTSAVSQNGSISEEERQSRPPGGTEEGYPSVQSLDLRSAFKPGLRRRASFELARNCTIDMDTYRPPSYINGIVHSSSISSKSSPLFSRWREIFRRISHNDSREKSPAVCSSSES